jgi:hypothetical protein
LIDKETLEFWKKDVKQYTDEILETCLNKNSVPIWRKMVETEIKRRRKNRKEKVTFD